MTDTTPNPLSFTTNGGPAFPLVFDFNDAREIYSGMSLRDWFAGKAMQGLMDAAMPMPEIAQAAYQMADAMLKERNK